GGVGGGPGWFPAAGPRVAVGGDEPPVAAWERTGVAPIGPAGTLQPFEGASPGFLLQLRDQDAPLRLVTRAAPGAYRDMADAVLHAAETMDVTEPQARVRSALALLAADERAA